MIIGIYDFTDVLWETISDDAKDVIKKLMCVDSNKRAELNEILSHKWISEDIEMKNRVEALIGMSLEPKNESNKFKRSLSSTSSELCSQSNNQIFKKLKN